MDVSKQGLFFKGLLFCLWAALTFLQSGCAFVRVKRSKDIVYLKASSITHHPEELLNVFAPRRHKKAEPVFVFIHGGNWTSGKKSLYSFLGNRMARKHVVTVIIDYPLSPLARYDDMALDAATAVKWVKENIASYGGDPDGIFVSGHSAGGHLAALIGIRNQYFEELHIPNPIKGLILIDAAGLDMYRYLKKIDYGPNNSYLNIFTKDPDTWRKASPLYNLHKDMPPMLMYQGGRTYPSIALGYRTFIASLKQYQPDPNFRILKGKKHILMITQFLNPYNPRYKEIVHFMSDVR